MAPEEPIPSPFTVLVDSAESHPFTFEGILSDARDKARPIAVPTRYASLGRHPHSLGDYSAEGLVEVAHVERKSVEDCQSTVLGWESPSERRRELAGRRDRFKQELTNLEKVRWPLVVVEGSLADCVTRMPSYGKKTAEVNAKVFFRSLLAFQADYRVPWLFCDSRRTAEVATYRWLARAWRKLHVEQAQEQEEEQAQAEAEARSAG